MNFFFDDVLKYSFVPTMGSVEDMLREQLPEEFDPELKAKYHEVGIVREGNRITGAIIKEGTVMKTKTAWFFEKQKSILLLRILLL